MDLSRKIQAQFRAVGEKVKLGHLGTLDPMAEGLILILFGQANKLQDVMHHNAKEYIFAMELGYSTDSLDTDGQILEKRKPEICDREFISQIIIPKYHGPMQQRTPIYSAVKIMGKPLYNYARANKIHEIKDKIPLRPIDIYKLELLEYNHPCLSWKVLAKSGIYVRQLASDLAEDLGQIATTISILRTQCGGYTLEEANAWDQCQSLDQIQNNIIGLDQIKIDLPALNVDNDDGKKLLNGMPVSLPLKAELTAKLGSKSVENESKQCFTIPVVIRNADNKLVGLANVNFANSVSNSGISPVASPLDTDRSIDNDAYINVKLVRGFT